MVSVRSAAPNRDNVAVTHSFALKAATIQLAFGTASTLVVTVTLVACKVPAWRGRVLAPPRTSLRQERIGDSMSDTVDL
jgi:hypothetical protein